jgi:hypothetical protein
MKYILFFFSVLLLTGGNSILADDNNLHNGVEFELIVRQQPEVIDKYFEITRDTIKVVDGLRQFTQLVNMGIDIEIENVDTQFVEFTCQLVTFGPKPYNFAKRYRIEYNLPARISNIPGKDNSIYQLLISPRKTIEIDTLSCPYKPIAGGDFAMDPSANFDIYFIKNSLGDFHWNSIKNYLEADYNLFKTKFDISTSSKMSLFLCPCASPVVNWDKRFGYAIDPGRANIYTIYSHDFVSTDAILPNMLRLEQLWGYAPPFLVEGIAGYFGFTQYRIKILKADSGIPSIKTILTTAGYYAEDPIAAEIAAASFAKYLINIYGTGKIEQLYKQSDDLTLLKNMEKIYGSPIDALESDWLAEVDTITFTRQMFNHFAGRANAINNIKEQLEYLEEMPKYDLYRSDTIDTHTKLASTYYQIGEYNKALKEYEFLQTYDTAKAINWQIIGNLFLINSELDSAWVAFDSVYAMDSGYVAARLQQAKILAMRGDTAGAIKLAEDNIEKTKSAPSRIEFDLLLGKLYKNDGMYRDSAKADKYFNEAAALSSNMMTQYPDDPVYKLRLGLAYFGLDKYHDAIQYLELARFIEQRAYNMGRILVNLGELYDVTGDHDKAIEYYQACLDNNSAEYHRELCRQYIVKPYKE